MDHFIATNCSGEPQSSPTTPRDFAAASPLMVHLPPFASLVPGGALFQLLFHAAGLEDDGTLMFRLALAMGLVMLVKWARPFRLLRVWFMCSIQVEGRHAAYDAVMDYFRDDGFRSLVLTRRNKEHGSSGDELSDYTMLYTFGIDARALMPMLHHMQAMYAEKMAGKHLEVYMTEIVDKGRLVWKKTSQRPRPRRLDTINMDDNVVDIVLNDIKAFLLEKNFYLRKGVPHRRGHLYHGAPGCGKSTLAQLVAGVFGLAIHIISLKTLHGSQEAIAELFGDMKKPGILLLEDIDTAGLANRDLDLGLDLSMMINDEINGSGLAGMAPKEPSKAESVEPPSLDVVLNVLDGVSSDEGRVVLMTTNRLDALDEALIRPGRIDLTIHCPLASAKVAQDMFYRFFGPDDESTAANSFEKKSNITKEQQAKIAHNDDGSSTTSSSRTKKPPSTPTKPALPRPQVQLERSEALELAKRFGEIMGGVLLSPAAIQGYCLQIRQDPVGGVEKASEWKEKTLGEAKERQLKKQTKG
ncbi:hypothetical protein PG996_005257 [Apiospora saccharicola]|uniref:AAA+ ATPase domain-containing protein n=1 Tax=Apiospora saccharicola TaxID=335842 RepID=A0ABR1VKZ6_9PEZI